MDFFSEDTLRDGTKFMIEEIIRHHPHSQTHPFVFPKVQPGFLRNALPKNVPEESLDIVSVIKEVFRQVLPGTMLWQSPRFFGYYPSNVPATSAIAELFASAYHSPAFNYASSPAHTQLENIAVDWAAQAMGLPKKFHLKGTGGGIINNSTSESIVVTVHAAKARVHHRLNIMDPEDPRRLKLVGYYSSISHASSPRALAFKDISYQRPVPCYYDHHIKNYRVNIEKFSQMLTEDTNKGLIPFWYGASSGTTFSGATDIEESLIRLCKQHNIWINLDAAYLGATWVVPQYRLAQTLIEGVDSICINFSKAMFSGTGGSLLYVGDKQQYTKSMSLTNNFSFYQNEFSGERDVVDYKDWIIGLGRRNNGIKVYMMFRHYGLNHLRNYVQQVYVLAEFAKAQLFGQKGDVATRRGLAQGVSNQSQSTQNKLFSLYCHEFGLIGFQMVCPISHKPSSELTKTLSDAVANIPEGFISPGTFDGTHIVRLVIGVPTTTKVDIDRWVTKVKAIAHDIQIDWVKGSTTESQQINPN